MSAKDGPTMNDADLWAFTGACELPYQDLPDEMPWHFDFADALELCNGNRKEAKALYWTRRSRLCSRLYGELGTDKGGGWKNWRP